MNELVIGRYNIVFKVSTTRLKKAYKNNDCGGFKLQKLKPSKLPLNILALEVRHIFV